MGKVFNDQIIKILCAKNLNKIQKEVGEPILSPTHSGAMSRGESYVIVLDKQHRRDLQRQMGGMDQIPEDETDNNSCNNETSCKHNKKDTCNKCNNKNSNNSSSNCCNCKKKMKSCCSAISSMCGLKPTRNDIAESLKTWFNTYRNKQSPQSNLDQLKIQLRDSFQSLHKLLTQPGSSIASFLRPRYSTCGHEALRFSPIIFGPFVDESVCAVIDHLSYCVLFMFGLRLEPQCFDD